MNMASFATSQGAVYYRALVLPNWKITRKNSEVMITLAGSLFLILGFALQTQYYTL